MKVIGWANNGGGHIVEMSEDEVKALTSLELAAGGAKYNWGAGTAEFSSDLSAALAAVRWWSAHRFALNELQSLLDSMRSVLDSVGKGDGSNGQ